MVGDATQRIILDRWAMLRSFAALAILTIIIGLITIGLSSHANSLAPHGHSDLALYKSIIQDVRSGESYYSAALRELRTYDYPLRPFVAVRPPAHALLMATLPDETMRRLALACLAIITTTAWAWHLARLQTPPVRYVLALVILGAGTTVAFVPNLYPFHEAWAGFLIALSMALRRPNAWLLSVLVGTSAALVRELAAPYLLVMVGMALKEGDRKEVCAWIAGILVFAIALAIHAVTVNMMVTTADLVSPSWLQFAGWHFVLQTASSWNLLLQVQPASPWIGAVLVPIALLGLTASGGPLGHRLALTVFGYTLAFLCVGRPDNYYWGLIIAPLWPLGLVTAWAALVRCMTDVRALFPKQAVSVPFA